ncbi:MAG: chemotaxis protein CheB [Archangiaceae bacterium]|nr:chemotaxis protein CheB [Archangiaceae bacterium]
MSATASAGHDIVVMGASAGGVEALGHVLAGLPEHLGAAVFTVLHMHPGWPSQLPQVFARSCRLPVDFGVHGEPIVTGRVYVAPPDNQLMVRGGRLQVMRGPKENGHRPSIDALFRSAASYCGARVVGVVLTGYQDDGTGGLISIKARGGLAVVQSPETAEASSMPQSVLDHVHADYVVPLGEMAALLTRLVAEPAGPELPLTGASALPEAGVPVELVCPVCNGSMTQADLEGYQAFRCSVGHVFSLDDVANEHSESVERALWAALRALEESAALSRRLTATSSGELRERHAEKARAQRQNAELIREIIAGAR